MCQSTKAKMLSIWFLIQSMISSAHGRA